jgi:hypothetical protein
MTVVTVVTVKSVEKIRVYANPRSLQSTREGRHGNSYLTLLKDMR